MVRAGLRIAASHHPLCSHFRAHSIPLFGIRWCRGCLHLAAGFLVGAVTVLPLLGTDWVAARHLVAIGLSMGWAQAAGYLVKYERMASGVAKTLGGIGLVWAVVGALLSWSWAPWLLLALGPLALAGQTLRWRTMLRTCDACPWRRDWAHCPGTVIGAPAEPPQI